jgi:hypothetical protein
MPKYLLAYHGGATPETEPEVAKVMAAWQTWMEGLGDALLDPGNPVGVTKTVTSGGVEDGGGANPLSGYSLLNATDIGAAVAMAKDCPIFESGGTIEVAETVDM